MLYPNRRDFVRAAGSVAAVMMVPSEGAAMIAPNPDNAPIDPVAKRNLQYREWYGINRQELGEANPLAALTLIGTGEISCIAFGRVTKVYPAPPLIAHIKGLMHGVIATQAVGARRQRGKTPDAVRKNAAALAAALEDSLKDTRDLPAEIAPHIKTVLTALQTMAAGWGKGKPNDPNEFRATLKSVMPSLDKVLDVAGEATYQSIAKNLQAFADEHPNEWKTCIFGVCGVGFARRDSVEIAAAMSVMGRDAVGTRLLYLESAFTIPAGITQIAAALADRELGQDVFGDPYRMWRDLLGDVAIRHAGGGFFPETGRPR